ncbi:polysaccharide deacetylase family protein [uncultured Modestobacter sp.]|uniref:polysaccharide deacetylase family protein n=1 Tax=uncultured Modestobacter sp. TaxID=380048 RepID=UPI0026238AA3|nr:polysaccharide deacetylase family protein [uncultured Modestobacter sp.]
MMGGSSRRRFLLGAGATGLAIGLGSAATAEAVSGAKSLVPAPRGPADGTSGQGVGAAFPEVWEEPGRFGAPRVVWSLPVEAPLAALTFDDGPTPEYTPRVLAALAAAGVTATFNVMGANAVAHPGLLREIVAAGHEVGNHSWSHRDQTGLTVAETRTEIVRCAEEVAAITAQPLTVFRPPRGKLTGYGLRVCAELGYDVWIWSCTRGPDGTGTTDVVSTHLARTVRAGDVVCLHDGLGRGTFQPGTAFAADLAARREVEVRALPDALRRIADRGITLTSAGQLLAAADREAAVRTLTAAGLPVGTA